MKILLTENTVKVGLLASLLPDFLVQVVPDSIQELTDDSPLYPYGLMPGSLKPKWKIPRDKTKLVSSLSKKIQKASEVWIATERTPKGEFLASQLRGLLPLDDKLIFRVSFTKLDSSGVCFAIDNPIEFDDSLVEQHLNSLAINSIFSSLVGNILNKADIGIRPAPITVPGFRALNLIVNREKEISKFEPSISYQDAGNLIHKSKIIIKSLATSEPIASLLNKGVVLDQINIVDVLVPPPTPWTLESLVGSLNLSPQEVVSAVEFLFHTGWISRDFLPIRQVPPEDTLFNNSLLEVYQKIYYRWTLNNKKPALYQQQSYVFLDDLDRPYLALGKKLIDLGWWELEMPELMELPPLKIGSFFQVNALRTLKIRNTIPCRITPQDLFQVPGTIDDKLRGIEDASDPKYSFRQRNHYKLHSTAHKALNLFNQYFEFPQTANPKEYESKTKVQYDVALTETRKQLLRRYESWDLAPCPFCKKDCIRYLLNDTVFIYCSIFPECSFSQVHKGEKPGIIGKCEKCKGVLVVPNHVKYPYVMCSRYPRCFTKRNLTPKEKLEIRGEDKM